MTNNSNNLVTQKALKLATALYMVTDIMSEKEPLKWHLRERAVSLLEATDKDIMSVIDETLAILAIARIARAVSTMNADILETEYRSLSEAVKEMGVVVAQEAIFSQDFFDVEAPVKIEAPKVEKQEAPKVSASKVEVKKVDVSMPVPVKPVIKDEPVAAKKTVEVEDEPLGIRSTYISEDDVKDTISEAMTSREAKVAAERNKRRDAIIRLMYEKGECNVKDITSVLKDVSDKTIQRELIAMMDEGIIAREGDRRWAVYHLA